MSAAAGRRRSATGLLFSLAALLACASASPDPIEPVNRRVFWFNEQFDHYLAEPVARGWNVVVPDPAQDALSNAFTNLRTPMVFVNDLLQLKPLRAGQDLARFFFNTTFGVGGLMDVATDLEIPENDEDLGQTLGFYGVPAGPYLVLPLLGPATPRGSLALVGDALVVGPQIVAFPPGLSLSIAVVRAVNLRALHLEDIREERAMAFDYYVFLRDAYLQNREQRAQDRDQRGSAPDDDLYHLEEE